MDDDETFIDYGDACVLCGQEVSEDHDTEACPGWDYFDEN